MRKKNDNMKVVQGTARKDRKATTKSKDVIPLPDRPMDESVKRVYFRIAEHLKDHNALLEVDVDLIYQAAKCVVRMYAFESLMESEGSIQIFQNGTRQLSPEYVLFDKERSAFYAICDRMGIGVKSREKIAAFQVSKEDEEDPIRKLLGGNVSIG